MLVLAIIIFLLLSALFSGSEIAFISASKLRVELSKQKGSRQGTILARFYEKPADFLGTMLVGNNIALVVFTYLFANLISDDFFESMGISNDVLVLLMQTIFATIIVLIFGEFLPKTFFRLYANEILYFLAMPLRILEFLLFIPAWMRWRFNFMVNNTFMTDGEYKQRFVSHLTNGEAYSVLFVNFLLLIVTLGLAFPWTMMRSMRLFINSIDLPEIFDLDELEQNRDEYDDATGDDLLDIFDMGLEF